MQYRRLGETGEKVSALGFGLMRLPLEGNNPGNIDFRKAASMVHEAIDLGVNYFDTAYPYHHGHSEEFLARVLKGSRRRKVMVADKLPSWLIRSPKDPEKYLEEQLRRLETDCIDLYLLHSLKKEWWKNLLKNDVLRFLDQARKDGKIRFAGFSFHDEFPVFKEIVDHWEWDFCQIQYNYMDAEEQAGRKGLHYAHGKGLGVVVMEPLKGGYLTRFVPPEVKEYLETRKPEYSPAEWALRWVWNQPEVSLVLSGMGATAEVLENCRVASEAVPGNLSRAEKDFLEDIREIYLTRQVIPCTACGYCLPCPEGVEIRDIFGIYNNMKIYDNPEQARNNYAFITRNEGSAEQCTACGTCEELCPQEISIIETLKKCHEDLSQAW